MDITIDPSFDTLRQMVRRLGKDKLRPLGIEADRSGRALPPDHPFFMEVLAMGLTGGFVGRMKDSAPRADDDGRAGPVGVQDWHKLGPKLPRASIGDLLILSNIKNMEIPERRKHKGRLAWNRPRQRTYDGKSVGGRTSSMFSAPLGEVEVRAWGSLCGACGLELSARKKKI